MAVLVDANVLLDILTADPVWLPWSFGALQKAAEKGRLLVNPIICAELSPAFEHDWTKLSAWLERGAFVLQPLPFEASVRAAVAHSRYRRAGGAKVSPLPDFYIGAHAETEMHQLLTRDSARYATYFPQVQLISPS